MKEITVHTIYMSDVEDPDLMVAQPIWEWQQTEKGKWVMENTVDPSWHRVMNVYTFGYDYHIRAKFTPEQITFYRLKFQ
jgi:hypothetical protein